MARYQRIVFVGDMALGHNRKAMAGLADFASHSHARYRLHVCREPEMLGELCRKGRAEGIILSDIPVTWHSFVREIAARVPLVEMSLDRTGTAGVNVCVRDESIGELAAMYFIDRGFRKLIYAGPANSPCSDARWAGFRQFAMKRGISADGVTHLNSGMPANVPDIAALARRLKRIRHKTAIFATDDELAALLVEACQEARLPVPDKVAILGVGDDELFTLLSAPSLSSISINSREMARIAMGLLDRLLRGMQVEAMHYIGRPTGVVTRLSSDRFGIEDELVRRALSLIQSRVQEGLSVKWLASEIGVSRPTLERRFASALRSSPAVEISRTQAELARRILVTTDKPIERIAVDVGYSSARQLRISLRDHFGKTPSELRGTTAKGSVALAV